MAAPLLGTPFWYSLRVRPNYEKVVFEKLKKSGRQGMLPTYQPRDPSGVSVSRIDRPLFPGYVIGRFALEERSAIVQMPGVLDLEGFTGETVRPIPDDEIEALERVLASGLPYGPLEEPLPPGQWMEVVRGPLRGLRGLTTGAGGSSRRLVLSVSTVPLQFYVQVEGEHVRDHGESFRVRGESGRQSGSFLPGLL